jgi:glutathione-regulated potassium-efflux system protein KefB
MSDITLAEIAVFLAALAMAAPLARLLGIGTVLSYLVAGAMLGPYGLRLVFSEFQAQDILHFAEFGVVLLLFLIGLELRPKRLWALRNAIFGLGSVQVAATATLLAVAGMAFGLAWQAALFVGFALALSSTAFALQLMEETGELRARHGRLGFAILLFQDLVAIPLIAVAPLFAVHAVATSSPMSMMGALEGLATLAAVIVIGRLTLDRLLRFVALAGVREAMTAAALLTVVGFTLVMQLAGLSASLGAFIAGALLAESSYRHQLEADIQPFEGLLLGLFFAAIGMSLNLGLLYRELGLVLLLTLGLVAIKTLVLWAIGLWQGLGASAARRLGLSLSQGGEFAFVLLAAGSQFGVVTIPHAQLLAVVVTMSMALTPVALALERFLFRRDASKVAAYDTLPDRDGHVVIAGFGRFGQIVGRILRAKKIPFTALDISAEQIEFVKKFGAEAFYGDASRPDILHAARTNNARAFVLAIDDVEASMRTAETVKQLFPHVPIYARARNRAHAYRLLDLGIQNVQRETFLSSLDITHRVLAGLGLPEREISRAVQTFRQHDERRLMEDYRHGSDLERMQERARTEAARLEKLFAEDVEEEAKAAENPLSASDKVRQRDPA